MCQCYLADQQLHRLLEKVDADLAQKTQAEGCCRCGDKLYYDSYPRKPRGGPATWDKRYSFTCATHRHRVTPPSVRFLGPKVYVMVVVVLISAMRHGLKAQRVQALRESLGIDRRTVERWRAWWLKQPSLRDRSPRSVAGPAQIPFSHHDWFGSFASHFLRAALFPAEDAERLRRCGGGRSFPATPPQRWNDEKIDIAWKKNFKAPAPMNAGLISASASSELFWRRLLPEANCNTNSSNWRSKSGATP